GQVVNRGDVIGNVSAPLQGEQAHFHFQVRQGRRVVNPLDFLPAVDPLAE
ncbi:MAG: hypothetical protein JWM80_2157, partial [Cyanobacteria bacterium RYN_339]|nr:hypothetical protein [Cyanobacteria bacterium RYN_339]